MLGDYDKLIITQYDTVIIGGYNEELFIDLDLNDDNIYDFRLSSQIWGSPGMGYHPSASIICLNTTSLIKGYITNDTIYYRIYSDTTFLEYGIPLEIRNTSVYSCEKSNPDDSIVEIKYDKFYMSYLSKGDSILASDIYDTDTYNLSDDGYREWPTTIVKEDITYTNFVQYYEACRHMPNDDILYIGILLNVKDNDKLGWLKICLSDDYKVLLLETAIEK